METPAIEPIKIAATTQGLLNALSELQVYLDAPGDIRDRFFEFCDLPGKLFTIKNSSASVRAGVVISFEPSEFLFDFLAACRARDFNALAVKYSHL